MPSIAFHSDERDTHYNEFFYELKSPEKVKPYYAKDLSFIEREPLLFYKLVFFILLISNVISFLYYNS